MAYIEMENLNKTFGRKAVVKNLNLSLDEGKILCLLGPSGCGKTTTLRMTGGFLSADSGSIRLDGEELTSRPPENRPVSTVFQSYALFPNMSVAENVMYGLKFKGVARKKARETALSKLEITGLSEYADARISELSGGQQQRVALARALAVEPKLMLLDEPLSNLDAKLRIRMREELKELQERLGMTMIFVTHDQEEAMVLADRIAIMHEGCLVQTGTPKEVYDHPSNLFSMTFLGTANRLTVFGDEPIWLRPEKLKDHGLYSEETETALHAGLSGDERMLRVRIQSAEYLGFYMQYTARTETGDEILLRGDSVSPHRQNEEILLSFRDADILMRGEAI